MRQLKAFMKAKKPMRNCGKCECLTLKCWRENDEFCNCGDGGQPGPVGPVPVETISSLSTESVYVGIWQTTTITLNYAPANANNFDGLDFDLESYNHIARVSVQSYADGVLTAAIEWLTEWEGECIVLLNWEDTGLSFNISVQPMYTITIASNDTTRGTVSETTVVVPEGTTYIVPDENYATLVINRSDWEDPITITATLVDPASFFIEWSVNGAALNWGTPYMVSGDVTIRAVFEEPCY